MHKIKNKKLLPLAVLGFFAVVAFLLAEANLLVYVALTNIFYFNSFGSYLLCLSLALLSGGFIAMMIVEKYYSNRVIRFFYIITSVWMGMFVYFFIGAVLYLFVNMFIGLPNIIGILFFVLALFVSIYGIIHGRKIFVKNIEVALPKIPDEWKGKKIVMMSDVHLNSIWGAKFSEKIAKISNSLSPDAVFVVGDLYDGTFTPDPLQVAKPLGSIVAPKGKFFVLGNHEQFSDPSIFLKAVSEIGFNVLNDSMVLVDGLQIVGVEYLINSNKNSFQKTLENLKIDKEKTSILLKHEPKDLDVAYDAGISFQVSGHTHDGQQWPFNYMTDIVYKGFGYGLKKYDSMHVYVSSGVGGWGPPIRVGSDYEIVCITLV
ncbi:MAG: metallophosphoesterase [bacterium]